MATTDDHRIITPFCPAHKPIPDIGARRGLRRGNTEGNSLPEHKCRRAEKLGTDVDWSLAEMVIPPLRGILTGWAACHSGELK